MSYARMPLRPEPRFLAFEYLGVTPIHGFQVITLALAIVLRLNKPLAMLGVSDPLHHCFHSDRRRYLDRKSDTSPNLLSPALSLIRLPQDSALLIGFIHFVIGSFVLAVVCGIAVFFISLPVFRSTEEESSC